MRLVLLLLFCVRIFTGTSSEGSDSTSYSGYDSGSGSGSTIIFSTLVMSASSPTLSRTLVMSTSSPTPSSTLVMPTSSTPTSMDDEGLPLYTIIGGAAGGGLILIIIVLLLILCYLVRRLKKVERKERPHIHKHSPAVNGDTAQHSPSLRSEDHTDRPREPPPSTSPFFHNPMYDGEVKSHPKTSASDQDGMYDTVSDEEAKRMRPDPRYAAPPSSHELDASYAYVSHDIFRKKAVRVSSGDPRKQLPRDRVASTETSKPQGYSEPIEKSEAIEESEYSHLQHHHTAATSSSKRHSAPLLSSNECTYDQLGNNEAHNSRVRYSNVNLPSSALEHPQPAHQPPSNPQQQTTLDHIYHVLEGTPPVSPSTAIGSPLPVLPYFRSEPEHNASNAYPQDEIQEIFMYDTIKEVTAPQAIYDTPVDIPQEIYDEVK